MAVVDFHVRPALAVSLSEQRVLIVDPITDRLLGIFADPQGFYLPKERPLLVEGLWLRFSLHEGQVQVHTEEGLLHTFGDAICCLLPVDVWGLPRLVTGSTDGAITIWDPASGARVGQPARIHDGQVTALCVMLEEDGNALLISAENTPGSPPLVASRGLFEADQ
ncbi:MAG: hypothetical protein Q4D96_03880 [Propionibacteriaceae bacterium]|nr:hypothetical protein [Propionibacteriaceae bacterium]